MAFAFESHVLPLLQEMAADPLDEFPLEQRIGELGLADTPERMARYLDYLQDSGYVNFMGQKLANGTYAFVSDARLTAKALQQLDLWPADNERALYLLSRFADAFEEAAGQVAEDGDVEAAGRLRNIASTLKSGLREVGTEVVAKVVSNMVTGS